MSKRRKWFNRNRRKIVEQHGPICDNCKREGILDDYDVHHIVPIVHGGTNYLSNLSVLCGACHGKAHGEKGWSERKAMQKRGIERAKRKGKYRGRPIDETAHKRVAAILRDGHSIRRTAELAGVSPSTVQRVKNENPKPRANPYDLHSV